MFVKRFCIPVVFLPCLLHLAGCGTGTGSSAKTGPAGSPGLVFIGPYVNSTPYVVPDVVTFQGSSYVALKSSFNIPPTGATTSGTTWAVLAEAGTPGVIGATGPQGSPGVQGSGGPQGVQGIIGKTGSQGPQGPIGATGSTGPAGEAGPSGPAGPAGAIGATGPAGVDSHLAGRRFGVQGDSISAVFRNEWQNVVIARTGMTLTYQEAIAGRKFTTAFECYGQPAVGGTLGVFDSTYGGCSNETGVMNGNTLEQNLANVDLLVIELGTNDQSENVGTLGDATTAGTFFGNMRWVVETYMTAKPTLRVVLVAVQYNVKTSAAKSLECANAAVAYGNTIGVPVINMYALGGVNAITLKALTEDGVHPSTYGFANNYGPVIAQALEQLY